MIINIIHYILKKIPQKFVTFPKKINSLNLKKISRSLVFTMLKDIQNILVRHKKNKFKA